LSDIRPDQFSFTMHTFNMLLEDPVARKAIARQRPPTTLAGAQMSTIGILMHTMGRLFVKIEGFGRRKTLDEGGSRAAGNFASQGIEMISDISAAECSVSSSYYET
jgi:hypothetical protein